MTPLTHVQFRRNVRVTGGGKGRCSGPWLYIRAFIGKRFLAFLHKPIPHNMSKTMRVIRYSVFPMTLYRIQPSLPVRLRDYDSQTKLGRTSYDLKLHNGLVLPTTKDTFEGPNGMSLRPDGRNFEQIIRGFRGEPVIYSIMGGTATPEGLVLLHEHGDHYSLQVSRPMPLTELNERLTTFLKLHPTMSREDYLKGLEDDNFDN